MFKLIERFLTWLRLRRLNKRITYLEAQEVVMKETLRYLQHKELPRLRTERNDILYPPKPMKVHERTPCS